MSNRQLRTRLDESIIGAMPRHSLSGWRATTAAAIGVASIALVLASSERADVDARPSLAAPGQRTAENVDAADRLPGTWLREYFEQGVHSRRLLHLDAGGSFREQVRIVATSGEITRLEHAGNWFYDGTNLKRKYTLMNGRSPSRLNLPFATFQIRFESRDEFVGTDHIHRNTVRYERVSPETEL